MRVFTGFPDIPYPRIYKISRVDWQFVVRENLHL